MALPSLTQHLAVLEGAGLVASDKHGRPGLTGWRHPVGTLRKVGSPANAEPGTSASTNLTSSSSTRRSHRDLHPHPVNADLDLELVRDVPASPQAVFEAWTDPASLKQWFAPRPYSISLCEIDLRPGGGSAPS